MPYVIFITNVTPLCISVHTHIHTHTYTTGRMQIYKPKYQPWYYMRGGKGQEKFHLVPNINQ